MANDEKKKGRFIGLLKKVTSSGIVKPVPGSGVIDQIKEFIEATRGDDWGLIYLKGAKLLMYAGMVGLIWYMVAKSYATDEIIRVIQSFF